MVGGVVSSEDLIDPRKVNGEVLVDAFFLRRVMPVMVPWHDDKLFQPIGVGSEVAVSPGGVKRDENQICHQDRLRESKHKRSEDKSAHESVVDEV